MVKSSGSFCIISEGKERLTNLNRKEVSYVGESESSGTFQKPLVSDLSIVL